MASKQELIALLDQANAEGDAATAAEITAALAKMPEDQPANASPHNKQDLLAILQQAQAEGDQQTVAEVTAELQKIDAPKPAQDGRTFNQAESLGSRTIDAAKAYLAPAVGVAEAAGAIGSGMANASLSGLAGIGGMAKETARQAVSDQPMNAGNIANAGTEAASQQFLPNYEPQTQAGKKTTADTMSALASPYNPLNAIGTAVKASGAPDYLAEHGQPAMATALQTGADFTTPFGAAKLAGKLIPSREVAAAAETGPLSRNAQIRNAADQFADPKSIKTPDKMAELSKPDQGLIDSADRLGLLDSAPAHIFTKDIGTKEVAGQLNASSGNITAEANSAFSEKLKQSAEELIQKAGGDLDSGALNAKLLGDMNDTHSLLTKQANDGYEAMNSQIDQAGKVDAKPMLLAIKKSAVNLENGVNDLSEVQKYVYKRLAGEPTYSNVDLIRKDIGHAIGSLNSDWTNAKKSTLNELYSGLTELQSNAAVKLAKTDTVAAQWETLKGIDKSRFRLQDNIDYLFGVEKNGSVIPKMDSALQLLSKKKDPKLFNEVMDSIPAEHRGAAIAASIRNIMIGTSKGSEIADTSKFNQWYSGLGKLEKKQINQSLPDGVGARIKDYYSISQSMENSAKASTSIVKDAYKASPMTMMDKLYGFADRTGGRTGRGLSALGQFFIKKSDTKTQAADNMMSSPEFKTAVLDYNKNLSANTAAQREMAKTKAYKDYMDAQSKEFTKAIGAAGLMTYLMSEENK